MRRREKRKENDEEWRKQGPIQKEKAPTRLWVKLAAVGEKSHRGKNREAKRLTDKKEEKMVGY
jgi:hypothetical protein